ncbi:hypothetical protein GQ473_01940 [archaeon]|nr:hypothetical protein [archaeon]
MMENSKIQMVGFDTDKIGDFEMEKVNAVIEKTFADISKITEIETLKIHLKIHKSDGGRHKHSAHTHLMTKTGSFDCEDFEWNALASISKALETLEFQVKKQIDKKADVHKHNERLSKDTL